MPAHPFSLARKKQLQQSRKEFQTRARVRIITFAPKIMRALRAHPHARDPSFTERTGTITFRWFGRHINYAITTRTLTVQQNNGNAVYTQYNPEQLIAALECKNKSMWPKLFSIDEDFRTYGTGGEK